MDERNFAGVGVSTVWAAGSRMMIQECRFDAVKEDAYRIIGRRNLSSHPIYRERPRRTAASALAENGKRHCSTKRPATTTVASSSGWCTQGGTARTAMLPNAAPQMSSRHMNITTTPLALHLNARPRTLPRTPPILLDVRAMQGRHQRGARAGGGEARHGR